MVSSAGSRPRSGQTRSRKRRVVLPEEGPPDGRYCGEPFKGRHELTLLYYSLYNRTIRLDPNKSLTGAVSKLYSVPFSSCMRMASWGK